MKICQACGQLLSESTSTCPACGHSVGEGRRRIDDYRLDGILHEGYSSTLCKAAREGADRPVVIRIFHPEAGVDEAIARRLARELDVLKGLPVDYFVQHHEIRRSSDGLWYRVSEWLDAIPWSRLLTSGRLKDPTLLLRLFHRIAAILDGLHQTGHFMPHLILNDIIVLDEPGEDLPVKIDYKVSRFLDPKLDRPGSMLRTLLESHPDIRGKRPLDPRSDIWSLGKMFVEILSGDLSTGGYRDRLDDLSLPPDLKGLLRLMLEEDPDLRPQTMGDVARAIESISPADLDAARRESVAGAAVPKRLIRSLRRRILVYALLPGLVLSAGLAVWLFLYRPWEDDEARLRRIANRYAASIAFVVADYRLERRGEAVYRGRTEGTAFLVDREGYLLTNRHVACPWLEDRRLWLAIEQLRAREEPLRFRYRLYLWFEGEKAFKRLPATGNDKDIEDVYQTRGAFRSDGGARVTISGVARAPEKTWQAVRSPLRDDFAVLKIDPVPEGLEPLPLDADMNVRRIPRLAPVIALGFPLGSQTQESTVNVSVTTGHVRRTFDTLLQVDTSLYRGNSGGPLIDARGKVIGIASSVAVDFASAPIPVATLLSDIGMVLPVTKAARFLSEIKAGRFKWNGELDLEAGEKLDRIMALAREARWEEARQLAEAESRASGDPGLLGATAMLAFCADDGPSARNAFDKVLSMDPGDQNARFMRYLLDWMEHRGAASPHRSPLLSLDWRSPYAFLGLLTRLLEGEIDPDTALDGADSASEAGWVHFTAGMKEMRRHRDAAAEAGFQAALLAAEPDGWLAVLAASRLEAAHARRREGLEDDAGRERHRGEVRDFERRLAAERQAREAVEAELSPVRARLSRPDLDLGERERLLGVLVEKTPRNRKALAELAFVSTMLGRWGPALDSARRYLSGDGPETAGRLRMGLLEPELLRLLGEEAPGRAALEAFARRTRDPWYRTVGECLLAGGEEDLIAEKAGEDPAFLVTGYTALGLWAEGGGDTVEALRRYKEALGSYMDDTPEYATARERIRALR